MFPNVRLMIAAMIAAVAVLGCGLAVFAAFRVNHEPLAYLAPVRAPLQLVSRHPASPSTTVVASERTDHGTRSNGTRLGGDPVTVAGTVGVGEDPAAASKRELAEAAAAATTASPEAPILAAAQGVAADEAAKPAGDQLPSAGPDAAALEETTDQIPSAGKTAVEIDLAPPGFAIGPAAASANGAALKKTGHNRLAAKKPHPRRHHPTALAQSNSESFTSLQPNFQTAPQPFQTQSRWPSVRRSTITPDGDPTSAPIGGPFVSPHGQ